MMRFLPLGLVLLAAVPAAADPVITITNMSCAKVQAAVKANGSVVLQWRGKTGLPLYARYASDRRFCHPGEIITISSVPAADKSCNVKKCVWKVPTRR